MQLLKIGGQDHPLLLQRFCGTHHPNRFGINDDSLCLHFSFHCKEEELKGAVLLIFANKQDQRGAYNATRVSEALGLPELRARQWSIQESSALKGKGIFEGMDWLAVCLKGGSD